MRRRPLFPPTTFYAPPRPVRSPHAPSRVRPPALPWRPPRRRPAADRGRRRLRPPRRFALLHQTIGIRFDVPTRTLYGTVTTRVAITQGPTDTLRLNAENLTIDKATDAAGKALRFTFDTPHATD